MKKTAIILSILVIIASSCGRGNKKVRPFQYNESGTLYSGAFAVSPDYFAELSLNVETGELTVLINGHKKPFDLSPIQRNFSGDLKEIFSEMLEINTEDLNGDGYVDFALTPNCTAKFPKSFVYFFDKEKENFVEQKEESEGVVFEPIGNTIGFISFECYGCKNDTLNRIEILNDDGSNWLSGDVQDFIEYTDGELNIRKNNNNEDFKPWAFEPGIGVFTIRCIAESENDYTIVANEEENIVKRLKKHKCFKFETVEEHVVNRLVGTDFSLNPIRENPNDDSQIIDINNLDAELIVSIERKGDWIKIENSETNEVLGWIRWKKDDRFMIWMYYSV